MKVKINFLLVTLLSGGMMIASCQKDDIVPSANQGGAYQGIGIYPSSFNDDINDTEEADSSYVTSYPIVRNHQDILGY